jgi:hypothetical protein
MLKIDISFSFVGAKKNSLFFSMDKVIGGDRGQRTTTHICANMSESILIGRQTRGSTFFPQVSAPFPCHTDGSLLLHHHNRPFNDRALIEMAVERGWTVSKNEDGLYVMTKKCESGEETRDNCRMTSTSPLVFCDPPSPPTNTMHHHQTRRVTSGHAPFFGGNGDIPSSFFQSPPDAHPTTTQPLAVQGDHTEGAIHQCSDNHYIFQYNDESYARSV